MCDFNKYLHYYPQAAAPQLAHIILPNAQQKQMMAVVSAPQTGDRLKDNFIAELNLCLECSNEIPQENQFYCNNIRCQLMEIEVSDIIYDIKEINSLSTVRKICIKCKLQTKLKNKLFCIQCLIALKQLVAKYQKNRENLLKELNSNLFMSICHDAC